MKQTCYGCKSSSWDKGCYECRLGYNIDLKMGKPLEECPKPKTNKEWVAAPYARQYRTEWWSH